MKNILATISILVFFSVCSFGQIKFDDAFKISQKSSCYDLNIEKIDIFKKRQKENDSIILVTEITLNNIGTMAFEQTANAYLELYDITGTERIKLKSWEFNRLDIRETDTFLWEQTYTSEDIMPTNFEAKIVLNGSFGECNLFNNHRLEERRN